MPPPRRAPNERIGQRLLDEGRISEIDHAAALRLARERGLRMEEALIETGAIEETALVQYIATIHQTQFVSSDKLSRSRLDRRALRKVPANIARHLRVYPLVYDEGANVLVVATADPDDDGMVSELTLVATVSGVRALVCRPRAVECAIARGYEGDSGPFRTLLAETALQTRQLLSPEMNRPVTNVQVPELASGGTHEAAVSEPSAPVVMESMAPAISVHPDALPPPGALPEPEPYEPVDDAISLDEVVPEPPAPPPRPERSQQMQDKFGPSLFRQSPEPAPVAADAPEQRAAVPRPPPPPRPSAARNDAPPAAVSAVEDSSAGRISKNPPSLRAEVRQVRSMTQSDAELGLGPVTPMVDPARIADGSIWQAPHIELIHVLVGMIDAYREGLAGHGASVARLARGIAERLPIGEQGAVGVVLAGLLHDVGKPHVQHITALSVVQTQGYAELSRRYAAVGKRLFGAAALPPGTYQALDMMYEQFEGGAGPHGLVGSSIPLEARILAVADSYADLTGNVNNAYGRILSAQEALAVLKSHTPRVFDPAVLSVLAEAMGSEGLLHDLLEQRRTVLLVDSDGQDTVPLQVKLGEYGFETQVARNVRLAEKALQSGTFAAVVSEIDIEAQDDGLQLLHQFDGRDRQLVWIFVAHRHERDAVRKAFALGADDVVAKPTDPELLCSKIEQLVDRKDTGRVSTGVSGSLEQLSLPDLVQVLYHGRRSCALRLEFAGEQGIVHIVEGNIVDASWQNVRGSDAFFALVALGNAGRFSVDPNAPAPSQPTIDVDSEHLLLQAVQRLDEARAGS